MSQEKIETIRNFIEESLHPDSKSKTHTTFTVEVDNQTTTIEIDNDFFTNTNLKDIENKLKKLNLSKMISQSEGKTIRILKDEILYLK